MYLTKVVEPRRVLRRRLARRPENQNHPEVVLPVPVAKFRDKKDASLVAGSRGKHAYLGMKQRLSALHVFGKISSLLWVSEAPRCTGTIFVPILMIS